jgi:serine-type D-Ala-D-Ala carboxypeptidase (penicillin-binding protein 5/6)
MIFRFTRRLTPHFGCPGQGFRRSVVSFLSLAVAFATVLSAEQAGAQTQNTDFASKARQAYLMDADSGAVLFQVAGEDLMYPASMSKLMTLAVLFRSLKEGTLKTTDEFVVSEGAWRRGGGPSGTSAMMIPLNSKVRLDELLPGIIIQSGNDACIVVAEGMAGSEDAFAKIMTEEGKRIGLKNSTFRNSTGLHNPDHQTTARDLAHLARHILKEYPEHMPTFVQKEYLYRKHKFINRNPLLFLNIGADGMKTGFTKEAGYGMVATAKQGDRRLIAVVNGLTTGEERKEEARKLLEWGFRSFTEVKLFDAGEKVGDARVWGGDRLYVSLVGNGDVNVFLPRFPANPKLKADIVYNYPLKAPIKKGDPVAKLRVTSSSNTSNEVQLYAADDVTPSPMWRRGLDTLALRALSWMP